MIKTGKITVKLRDAVSVCLMAEGNEADEANENSIMEICHNVTGPRRKDLATAVGNIIDMNPVYQKAPTYAFTIGEYIIDQNETLIGEENKALTDALAVSFMRLTLKCSYEKADTFDSKILFSILCLIAA